MEVISVKGTPRTTQEILGIVIHFYTFPPNQSWNNGDHPISSTLYFVLLNEKKISKQGELERTPKTQSAGDGLGRRRLSGLSA